VGPEKALRRTTKAYNIYSKGRADTVSIDRLQSAHVLVDVAEQTKTRHEPMTVCGVSRSERNNRCVTAVSKGGSNQ